MAAFSKKTVQLVQSVYIREITRYDNYTCSYAIVTHLQHVHTMVSDFYLRSVRNIDITLKIHAKSNEI